MLVRQHFIFSALWKKVQDLSLKSKIMAAMILTSLIPTILIGSTTNLNAMSIYQKQLTVYSSNLLGQMSNSVEDVVGDADKISLQIMARSAIQSYDADDRAAGILSQMELEKYLATMQASNGNISSIFVCMDREGILSANNFNETQRENYRSFRAYRIGLSSAECASVLGMHRNEFESKSNGDTYVMTVSRAVVSSKSSRPVVAILVDIPQKYFDAAFSATGKRDSLYIVDGSGALIYAQDPSQCGKKLDKPYLGKILSSGGRGGTVPDGLSGTNKYVRYLYSPKMRWFYVAEVDTSDIMRQARDSVKVSALIILLSFSGSILLSFLFATSLTKPIHRLVKSIQLAQDGNFDEEIAVRRNDEIGVLTRNYNGMLKKIRSLLAAVKEESLEKRRSDLNFLQAQITPHFIYNFLNTIKAVANTHHDEKICKLSAGLISLLSTSINPDTIFIPVREEIKLARDYLYLQAVRYGNSFQTVFEVDDDILSCMTLKLLLQPILENALIHGLDLTKENGFIVVRAYRKGGRLLFEVEDNGRGMQESRMAEAGNPARRFSGIGIKNIRERLRLYYGDGYTVRFQSRANYGTRVTIDQPVIEEENGCKKYV